MTRFVRAGIALSVLTTLGWLGGCSDNPGSPGDPPALSEGLIVSDPVTTAGLTASAGIAAAVAGSAADDVAYVSLAPGTVPAGARATVHRVGDVATLATAVIDGGFDPIPVAAEPGDFIDILVKDAGGGTLFQQRVAVRPGRRPSVVRTNPGRGKTDIAINAVIVVVFSEPVAGATLTPSSVRLLRGTIPVAGTVRLLEGSGAVAAFTPAAPLNRNASYRMVVTQAVRDLDGDALDASVTVAFTTGQASTGPAASIAVSPDTVSMMAGATYQMTATVRDAAGNELIDRPVTWSTSDPAGLSVSPTGVVTALAAGTYVVTATVNGLTASAGIYVNATSGPPASVVVTPTPATVAAFDTIMLTATVRDAAGVLVDCPPVSWTSSASAVATTGINNCVALGLAEVTVTGVSPGSVTITATSGTASGTASVTVTPGVPVAFVTVTPAAATLVLEATRQLSATLQDATGRMIGGRPIAWRSDNSGVATVDANGVVTGVSVGAAAVTATSDGVSDAAAITVTAPITLRSVSAGSVHTCGLTPTGAAYCWGDNDFGQLGDGSMDPHLVPVAVTGGLTFSAVSAGDAHTCGIATNGQAYCWGAGRLLGDASTNSSSVPVAVTGGLTFSAITAGGHHTCGLTPTGAAYCWGNSNYGELGDGSTNSSLVPVAVTGGLTFSAMSAGWGHTCGVTTSSGAYCWGLNSAGQLGNGSYGSDLVSSAPVAVTGGLTFSAVNAGHNVNTCGLTTTSNPYCWGEGTHVVGDGRGGYYGISFSPVPMPVIGAANPLVPPPNNLIIAGPFASVSAGGFHTCWITPMGAAYCGFANGLGQRGDGTYTSFPFPGPVTGGLTFSALSAGVYHTCGITAAGLAYCWGANGGGQLGDGSTTNSNVPVKVAGQP